MDLNRLLDYTDAALEVALALFLLGGAGLALVCAFLGVESRNVNREQGKNERSP